MENASKALLMAGGILVALLIIGVLVLMFTLLGRNQQSQEDMLKSEQIAKFNNQFEPYNRDKLSLIDLKTIYNKIESIRKINEKNETPEYNIETNIDKLFEGGKITDGKTPALINDPSKKLIVTFPMFRDQFSEIKDTYKNKANLNFRCDSIEYNGIDGRISKMTFAIGYIAS